MYITASCLLVCCVVWSLVLVCTIIAKCLEGKLRLSGRLALTLYSHVDLLAISVRSLFPLLGVIALILKARLLVFEGESVSWRLWPPKRGQGR